MVAIPDKPAMSPEQAMETLKLWYEVSEKLSTIKVHEILLRKQLAAFYVPDAREGVNRVDIGDGFDLVLDHKINRSVDETLLDEKLKEMRQMKIHVDELFPYKPSLSVAEYRKLSAEQKLLVDSVLDISVGTPSLDIGKKPQDNSKYVGGVEPGGLPGVDTSIVHEAPSAAVTYVMTPLADGVEYEAFIERGWTNEQLLEHRYMVAQEPEGTGLPPKPKRKRRKKSDGE